MKVRSVAYASSSESTTGSSCRELTAKAGQDDAENRLIKEKDLLGTGIEVRPVEHAPGQSASPVLSDNGMEQTLNKEVLDLKGGSNQAANVDDGHYETPFIGLDFDVLGVEDHCSS
ncbi:hypothetical protein V6N11_011960 [Hibiscus sabdariffa]|uniref:Uncharacterized protein n=2 Tax=Hibiscus sabdariffa TaxID=183260 RepID=A0ABR2D8G3_9ROSI